MMIISDRASLVDVFIYHRSRSKIADFYCFSIDKCQLERRASMLDARTTHAYHMFDDKILGKSLVAVW